VGEHLQEASHGCANINEKGPVFSLHLLFELSLDLFTVRVEGFIRELVLLNHLREAINMAARVEDDQALFESVNFFSHEVDQYFEHNFLGLSHLLSGFRGSANFR